MAEVPEFDPVEVLRTLTRHHVAFVLIGGIAARLRGAPVLTEDIDVTPDRRPENLTRIGAALRELDARLRTARDPDGVAFPIDPAMLATNDSWTLVTRAGDLDLVFSPAGTGGYPDLRRGATTLRVADDPPLSIEVAALSDVIRSKEAAGRDKDRAMLPLLRKTLEQSGGP